MATSKGINITVPDTYDEDMTEDVARSEVLAIQRLLTLSRRAPIRVMWAKNIASRVLASPMIFPLLRAQVGDL